MLIQATAHNLTLVKVVVRHDLGPGSRGRSSMWFLTRLSFHARAGRINVYRLFTVTFVIAWALSGLAGGLHAPLIMVDPQMGLEVLAMAFMVVIIGGLGTIKGMLVSGFLRRTSGIPRFPDLCAAGADGPLRYHVADSADRADGPLRRPAAETAGRGRQAAGPAAFGRMRCAACGACAEARAEALPRADRRSAWSLMPPLRRPASSDCRSPRWPRRRDMLHPNGGGRQ